MAMAALSRQAFSRRLIPITLALSSGVWTVSRQQPLRLDAATSPPPRASQPEFKEKLDPNILRQVSGGSLTGLLAGLLVSTFSKTLVLLVGMTIVVIQIAARYGIDLVKYLRMKERAQSSRILSALNENFPYKLSFGATFAMSAFMRF